MKISRVWFFAVLAAAVAFAEEPTGPERGRKFDIYVSPFDSVEVPVDLDLASSLVALTEYWQTPERQLEGIALYGLVRAHEAKVQGVLSDEDCTKEGQRIVELLKRHQSLLAGRHPKNDLYLDAAETVTTFIAALKAGPFAPLIGKAGRQGAGWVLDKVVDGQRSDVLDRLLNLGPKMIDAGVFRAISHQKRHPDFARELAKLGVPLRVPDPRTDVAVLARRYPLLLGALETVARGRAYEAQLRGTRDEILKAMRESRGETARLLLAEFRKQLPKMLAAAKAEAANDTPQESRYFELAGASAHATLTLAARLTTDPRAARRLDAAARFVSTVGTNLQKLHKISTDLAKEGAKMSLEVGLSAYTCGISLLVGLVDFALSMGSDPVADLQMIAEMVRGLHEHLDRLEQNVVARLNDVERAIVATHFSVLEGFRRVELLLRNQAFDLEKVHEQLGELKTLALQADLASRRYATRLHRYFEAQVAAECREPSTTADFFRCLERIGNGAILSTPAPVLTRAQLADAIRFPFFFSGGAIAAVLGSDATTRDAFAFLRNPLRPKAGAALDLPPVFEWTGALAPTVWEGSEPPEGALRSPDAWLRASAAFAEYAALHQEWIVQDPARFRRLAEVVLNQGLDFENGYLRLGAEPPASAGSKRNSVPVALAERYANTLTLLEQLVGKAKQTFEAKALGGVALTTMASPSRAATDAYVASTHGGPARKSVVSVRVSALEPGRYDESTQRLRVPPCDPKALYRRMADRMMAPQLESSFTEEALALWSLEIPKSADIAEGLPAVQRELIAYAPYLVQKAEKALPTRLVACIESIDWHQPRVLARVHSFRSTTNQLCEQVRSGQLPDAIAKDASALCEKLKAVRNRPKAEERDDFHLLEESEVLTLRRVGQSSSLNDFPEVRHVFAFGYPSFTMRLAFHGEEKSGATTHAPAVIAGRVRFVGTREVQYGSAFVPYSEEKSLAAKRLVFDAPFLTASYPRFAWLWPNGNRSLEYFRSGTPKDGIRFTTSDVLRNVGVDRANEDDVAVVAETPAARSVVDRYAGDPKAVSYRSTERESLGSFLLAEVRQQLAEALGQRERDAIVANGAGKPIDPASPEAALFNRRPTKVVRWETNRPMLSDRPFVVPEAERSPAFSSVPLQGLEAERAAEFGRRAADLLVSSAKAQGELRDRVLTSGSEGLLGNELSEALTTARTDLANVGMALRAVSYLAFPSSALSSASFAKACFPNPESLVDGAWRSGAANTDTALPLANPNFFPSQRKMLADLRAELEKKGRERAQAFATMEESVGSHERHPMFQRVRANLHVLRTFFANPDRNDEYIRDEADALVAKLRAKFGAAN